MKPRLILSGLFWQTVRFVRTIGRPLWQLQIGGVPVWARLSALAYQLPIVPDSVQLPWGHTLHFPKGFQGRVEYYLGRYEPELTKYISSAVQQGMHVVDAGANIGYYTLLMSHLVGDSGVVYAFEPEPTLYRALTSNIEANRLRNVRPYPYALSNESAEVTLYADSKGVSSSLIPDPSLSLCPVQVRSATLDEIIPEDTTISLVKIDVEGAELLCLQGMSRLINQGANMLVILEMNLAVLKQLQLSPEEFVRRLHELGLRGIRVLEYQQLPLTLTELPVLIDQMRKDKRKVVNLVALAGRQ